MRRGRNRDLLRRLLGQARPHWAGMSATLAASIAAAPLTLLTPLPIKIAVDCVIGSQPLPATLAAFVPGWAAASSSAILGLAAVLTVLITVLIYGQSLVYWLLLTSTGEQLTVSFRAALFRHVQRLSLRYHDEAGSTSSTYRIQYDALAIQQLLVNILIPMITSALTLAGMLCVTAAIDGRLAVIAIAIAPVLYLLTSAYSSRLRDTWHTVKDLESSAMGIVQETLASLRVVKAFGRERHQGDRFVAQSGRHVLGQMTLARLGGRLELLIGATIAAGSAATLYVGVRHVQSGALTLGQLLLVLAYIAQMYEPLKTISNKVTDAQSSLASAERAFALLDEMPAVADRPDARPLARARGEIVFDRVSFSYDAARPVLSDVSFQVPPGAHVGIVGDTGAGKTTLISLVIRFFDPIAGTIRLDDVDLRDYRLADLQNQFALVLQEPVLFSTSIAENIAYGRPSASEAEIVEAARAAHAHDFITRLPDGYRTPVGERGMSLSGGERQRISLARAFLKDAPILILDEPTASVDVKTESDIVDALTRLTQGRTTFIIAHRTSTLRDCDMTLLIAHGRIAGMTSGTPAR